MNDINLKIITILIMVSGIRPAIAQQSINTVVDAAAATFMKNTGKVGLSVGIVDHGHFYRYNYGETAPGSGVKPTAKTLYELGSISKTFTALFVAHAIAEGKMKLNDDIRLYLKGSSPNLQYNGDKVVKLVYLLNHIVRFPRFAAKPDLNPALCDLEKELHAIKLDTYSPTSPLHIIVEHST